jgi:hypothetical protein
MNGLRNILPKSSNGRHAQTIHAPWKIFTKVKNYIHCLISATLLSPFGQDKQKLHHLSRRRLCPNHQTAAVRKPFMCYGKFSQK